MNKERWQKLMQALGLPPSLDCFKELYSAYSEKHRYYHTTKHIDAMLRHLDTFAHLAERRDEVELAIWFHDAIYKPFSSSNEVDSADWAKEFLLANDYDKDGIQRVHDLIMATLHNGEVSNRDQKLLVDIDLSILGTSAEVYDQFERHVRQEYKLVPSFVYHKKRKQILQSFLARVSIYNLDEFSNQYEQTARENIQRAINNL